MNVRVPFKWLMATSFLTGQLAVAQDWQGTPAPAYGQQIQYASAEQYGAPAAGAGYYQPETYYSEPPADLYQQLLPSDRGFRYGNDSRLQLNTRQMMRGVWGRIEYLQGNIGHQDPTTLGTPLVVVDPNGVLPDTLISDPGTQFTDYVNNPAYTVGSTTIPPYLNVGAQAATTSGLKWKNAQGIRGSFGVPITDDFEIEGRYMGFDKSNSALEIPRFPPTTIMGPNGTYNNYLMVTPVTVNGQAIDTSVTYDAGFNSSYRQQYQGGDVSLVYNWKNPEEGWRVQPILGYRHEDYSENLSFGGSFDNRSGFLLPLNTVTTESNNVTSDVHNARDMLQVGMRLEWQKKFVTLGIQERLGMGSNIAQAGMSTTNFFEPGTGINVSGLPTSTTSSQRRVTFVPTSDLDAYVNIRMSKWFTFRVGYNLIWLGGVAAADRSMRFNVIDDGAGTVTPDLNTHIRSSNRSISSLTIGGEIAFP